MALVDKLENNRNSNGTNIDEDSIFAIADGKQIDVSKISDSVFAEQIMGKTIAFEFTGSSVQICAPATGILTALFPTGHAFGITMKNGIQILVHIGIDTVETQGKGFTILDIHQGDYVTAGTPIVNVDFETLKKTYDMSTMLIITNSDNQTVNFTQEAFLHKGDRIN